jgi:hypothetical protein
MRTGLAASSAVLLIVAGWLGSAAYIGSQTEAALQSLTASASNDATSFQLTNLAHQRGWFSSSGTADIALTDDCSNNGSDASGPVAKVEYRIAHLPLPSGLAGFDWAATPIGDTAEELSALIGPNAKVTGSGKVAFQGDVSSDFSIPELSRRSTGLKVSPSGGNIRLDGRRLLLDWKLDRLAMRSAAQPVEMNGMSLSIDLQDRKLGTGAYALNVDKLSLRDGTVEGLSLLTKAVARDDRFDTTVTAKARQLAVGNEALKNLQLEFAVTDLDAASTQALNQVFRSSCGFQQMTADEQSRTRQALSRILSRGMKVGLQKLALATEDGSIDGRIELEMTPSKDERPSLVKQLRSAGDIAVSLKRLSNEQRQAMLDWGFQQAQDSTLKASFEITSAALKVNGKQQQGIDIATMVEGLHGADLALASMLNTGSPSKKPLSDALSQVLTPQARGTMPLGEVSADHPANAPGTDTAPTVMAATTQNTTNAQPALPDDVAKFVERRDRCEHFVGEEGYDAERAAFLTKNIVELCTGSKTQLVGLRQKYKANPLVTTALQKYAVELDLRSCTGGYGPATWTGCVGSRELPNGDRYSGGYLNGKAHGIGVYQFADGRKYDGDYSMGVRHGSGTEYQADGSIALSGRWTQGKFIEP